MANGLMIEREAPLPGVAELRVHGDVDLGGGKRLERELEALMADGRSVLVNLEGCTFLDSSGLSALLRTARQTPLRGASPRVDVADFDHHGYGRIEATRDGLTCDLVRMATIKSRTSKKVAPISYDVKRGQTSIKGVNGPPPKQS